MERVQVHLIPVLGVILGNLLGVGVIGAIGLTHQLWHVLTDQVKEGSETI